MANDVDFGLPGILCGRTVFLVPDAVGGGYHLELWDTDLHEAVPIGAEMSDTVGGGGEPVILGGSDPADFVLFRGDIIMIGARRLSI